ncbi:hypothetical protein Bbelb_305380 [Branchiostoma belcheri]|nr:hypothetical protein Bbelb_305380 [Branchiostoma belcheri]
MDASTTYIDTRIATDFNPNILPPGGWHTAEVCGEKHTDRQPSQRIWNTVLVTQPPGSQASQPKQQQQKPAATFSESIVRAPRNPNEKFSFDKVENWTISQIDDLTEHSRRRSFPQTAINGSSFPQKAIVGPSAVQAAPSPPSSAPFPQNPAHSHDKKVRFSLTDEVLQDLSASYENIPFDPDEKRPPALGGIQAVSFNAEKMQGWTIVNFQQFPLPPEMLKKQQQVPGEMFITYVEDGKLKIIFLQKPTEALQEEYENDKVRSKEHKKQNGVHNHHDSANGKGQKSVSVSSKFSEETRRESQTDNVSSVGSANGLSSNHGDLGKLVQTTDNRRESEISNASSITSATGLLNNRDSMIQPTNNRREPQPSNGNISVNIGPAVQPNDSSRSSRLVGTSNGYSDGVTYEKESVEKRESHFSLAGSVKDWSWQPAGGDQTTVVQSSMTTGAEQQEENTPAPTQVLVNGQHYYVTKEDNAPVPQSTLRKIDSGPEQPSGPPDRPPPSYDVLDTVPKLPLDIVGDDNASVSSIRSTSTTASVRAAISATEDVLVNVTKGEGKSLHVNVRPPEGMSPGDIEVNLDLAVLDENELSQEPITQAPAIEEPMTAHRREEPIADELRREPPLVEYRKEEPMIEELREEQPRVSEWREEEHIEVQVKERSKMDDVASVGSRTSRESRKKKKTRGSSRRDNAESVASRSSSEYHRNTEKKKMLWSNMSLPRKTRSLSREPVPGESMFDASLSSGNRSYRKPNKQSGQGGLARLTSKFKKSQKGQ